MTIRKAKTKLERRIKRKERIKRATEYVILWVFIILAAAITIYPVQYLATKHCINKMLLTQQVDKEKTHVTILIGGEKITLEDVDVVHVEEE